MGPAQQPIIVLKKKAGHGLHHGGAWKVAYADFVTAMMALFIVLWLMNTNQQVKDNISGYFRDPKGFMAKKGGPKSDSMSISVSKAKMDLLKGKLEKDLKEKPEFTNIKDYVKMTITGEGLRIELLENEKGMFFESGRPTPTQRGKDVLEELAKQLTNLGNPVLIEGHTDSKPYGQGSGYSNWELSVDRANAARRIMESVGLRPHQVAQVRGFADNHLRLPDKPQDSSNRRVSIIVQYPELAAAETAISQNTVPGLHLGNTPKESPQEKH